MRLLGARVRRRHLALPFDGSRPFHRTVLRCGDLKGTLILPWPKVWCLSHGQETRFSRPGTLILRNCTPPHTPVLPMLSTTASRVNAPARATTAPTTHHALSERKTSRSRTRAALYTHPFSWARGCRHGSTPSTRLGPTMITLQVYSDVQLGRLPTTTTARVCVWWSIPSAHRNHTTSTPEGLHIAVVEGPT